MSRIRNGICLALGWLAVSACAYAADSRPGREFAQKATWQMPAPQSVRQQVDAWLAEREVADDVKQRVAALWESALAPGNTPHLLDVVCATFAAVDPPAAELVAHCSRPREQVKLPDVLWLVDEKTPAFERNNLRLLYARWLVQESLYDEASEHLIGLQPADVVDPAALLFYQAVVHHRTLAREPGLAAISKLLENESQVPRRYTSLAKLMEADLSGLKEESLDHIARRMDDIRRRLDLGRAGPKVRQVEDGVIASLDKLIEEMEKQQQAAAAAAAAAGGQGGRQSAQPAQDSMPLGGKGPGEVAKKPIGDSSGWGDLPPRERQEALQQIGKEFPAHYRDVIEQYFRRLANEDGENTDR